MNINGTPSEVLAQIQEHESDLESALNVVIVCKTSYAFELQNLMPIMEFIADSVISGEFLCSTFSSKHLVDDNLINCVLRWTEKDEYYDDMVSGTDYTYNMNLDKSVSN